VSSRAALYSRVLDSRSTQNSLLQLRRYAEGRQWTIAGEFADVGIAGVGIRRPGLSRMLEAIAAGNVDVVLTGKLPDLFQDSHQIVRLLSAWLQQGVDIACLEEFVDSTTVAGKAEIAPAIAFFDRFIAARQSELVKCGLARASRPSRLPGVTVNRMEVLDTYHAGMSGREAVAAIRRRGGRISASSYRRALTDLRSAGMVREALRAAALEKRGGLRKGGRPPKAPEPGGASARARRRQ